jgi:hypothetical protein
MARLRGHAAGEAVPVLVVQGDAHGLHDVPVGQLQQQLARAVRAAHLGMQPGAPAAQPLARQLLAPGLWHLRACACTCCGLTAAPALNPMQ